MSKIIIIDNMFIIKNLFYVLNKDDHFEFVTGKGTYNLFKTLIRYDYIHHIEFTKKDRTEPLLDAELKGIFLNKNYEKLYEYNQIYQGYLDIYLPKVYTDKLIEFINTYDKKIR